MDPWIPNCKISEIIGQHFVGSRRCCKTQLEIFKATKSRICVRGIHIPSETGCEVRILGRFALEKTAVDGSLVRVVGKGNTSSGVRPVRPLDSCVPLSGEDTFPPRALVYSEPGIYRGFPSRFPNWGFAPSDRESPSPVWGALLSSPRGPCPFCHGRCWGWRTPAPRGTVAVKGATPDVSLGPLAIGLHPAAVRWWVVIVSPRSRRLLQKPKTMELLFSFIFKKVRLVLQSSHTAFWYQHYQCKVNV